MKLFWANMMSFLEEITKEFPLYCPTPWQSTHSCLTIWNNLETVLSEILANSSLDSV